MKLIPTEQQKAEINKTRASLEAQAKTERRRHRRLMYTPLNEVLMAAIEECRNGSYATKIIKDVVRDRKIRRLTAPIGELCRK